MEPYQQAPYSAPDNNNNPPPRRNTGYSFIPSSQHLQSPQHQHQHQQAAVAAAAQQQQQQQQQQVAYQTATQHNIPSRLIPGGPPALNQSPNYHPHYPPHHPHHHHHSSSSSRTPEGVLNSATNSPTRTSSSTFAIPEEGHQFAPTTPHRYMNRRSQYAMNEDAATTATLPSLDTNGRMYHQSSPQMMDLSGGGSNSPHHYAQQPHQHGSNNPWANSPLGSPLSNNSRVSPVRRQQQQQPSLYAHASPRPPVMQPNLQPSPATSTSGGGSGSGGGGSQEYQYSHQRRQSSPIRANQLPLLHNQSSATQLRAAQQHQAQQSYSSIPPPTFRHVRSKSELSPVMHSQPKYRRAVPEGGFLSPLNALTTQLLSTYQICNPQFNYQSSKNPRRVLTKPSEGKLNNGFDNQDSDYILYVNDILGVEGQRRYLVLDILGQGTFGQVVKCQNMLSKEIVAVKVIKNKPAYLNQSMMEVSILEHLNNHVDKGDEHNLLRLKDRFMHKEHLCLAFELLSSNLYELIKQNQFRGLSTNLVRVFAQQLLQSLVVLKDARLIHCDLKPENILLKSLDSPVIKVIDFGSACHERQTVYTYIQSRFYRSPEVLLGLPYTTSIDMWSLGCICAELFLGLPIFPGTSEYNQISRITDTLGLPPNWMVEMGKNSGQFMEKYSDEYGRKQYRLKSREKYSREYNCDEQPSKQYFPSTDLREIIMSYPLPRKNMRKTDMDKEMANRVAFVDFIQGLLNLNPFERWTPQQAANHPFVTEAKFTGPYVPNQMPKDGNALPRYTAPQPQPQPQSQPPPLPNYYKNPIPQQVQPHLQAAAAAQPQQQQQQYRQSSTSSTTSRRPRATTIGNLDPIPGPIQRATGLLNNADPIRAQPSPAYIPPPELYNQDAINANSANRTHHTKRPSQGGANNPYGEVVRHLEDGLNSYSFD